MTAPDIAIEVEGLTKSFGDRVVVRDLSMRVRRGTIYGFLGPNGSGKTTTIRMLCGLLTPDSGRGTCLGYDIRTEAEKIRVHVGYMTQRFSLYQDLSVRENLEFVARVYGLSDPQGAAKDMVTRLGLAGREEQLAGSLSGGWKQRLALGACTLPNPQLLLLDEPTAGVDPKARREFWSEIHALAPKGSPCWSRPTTWTRPSAVTRSPTSPMASCWRTAPSDEVIGASRLTTFNVSGEGLAELGTSSNARPASTWWRRSAPACMCRGRDGAALETAIAPYRESPSLAWERAEPTLEDVFIDLMSRSKDNFP
jgi:ABC-2 type transport system ATP-binding protein